MKQLLSDAIDDFRKYRLSNNAAANTLRGDRQTLKAFLAHCGNIYVDNVRSGHVTEFLANRTDTRSGNSIGVDHDKLSVFYKWAVNERRCPTGRNPMNGRRKPKKQERDYPRVPMSDFPLLLEKAGQRHPRDRAFIALGLFTMGRDSELCSLRVGDLDLAAGRLKMTIHKSKTFDNMGVGEELDREMRRWLTAYSLECGNLQDSWLLAPARRLVRYPGFGGNEGVTELRPENPISHSASQVVQPALRAIGWEDVKGTGVHTLRRSSAQASYEVKADLGYDYAVRFCKEMLHHKSFQVTEGYIGVSGDKARRDDMLIGRPMFGLPGAIEIGAADSGDGEREDRCL